ncbi:MAG: hypothetical protein JOZ29_09465, partial [Deltaproteobacteria bacterium]|nr:hypothetical protein [Deltaproteobacteria bacterium]
VRLLCERLGQSQLLARVVAYQFAIDWSLKNFANARECTEQLQDLAARTSNGITYFLAGSTAGFLSNTSGDYVSARDYLERALNLSDETRRELINANTAIAFVNATGQFSLSLWVLGYPEQARNQHARLLDLVGKPIDAYAQCSGFDYECQMSEFIRDNRRRLEAAQKAVALARESGVAVHLGME